MENSPLLTLLVSVLVGKLVHVNYRRHAYASSDAGGGPEIVQICWG